MTKFRLGNTRASKLTAAQVVTMRREWADGAKQSDLSRRYGVSPTTVHNIIYGLTWQNLPAAIPDEQIMFEANQSLEKLNQALEITDPSDVGLTPEAIEKLNRELMAGEPNEFQPTETAEDVFRRRAGGQQNDQGNAKRDNETGGVRQTVEPRANEEPISRRGPGAVLDGPQGETGEGAGETGEDA